MKVTDALTTGRRFVKFHGIIDEAVVIDGGRVVTFLADPGAKLTRSNGNGAIITVRDDGTSLAVYDLTVADAPNAAGGIGFVIPTASGAPALSLTRVQLLNNPGGGISATGGTLTVTQSTLSGNQGGGISATGATLTITESTLSGNNGGGISATGGMLTVTRSTLSDNRGGGITVSGNDAAFDITSSFVIYNGVASGPGATRLGGVALLPNKAGSRFEYNTVAFNQSDGALFAGGVSCLGAMVAAAGNILYGNVKGAVTNDATQKDGDCQFGSTLALGSTPGDLGFKSPRANPIDFHLSAASPSTVVDAGGMCTGSDFDGQTRPLGSGCDLGADEVR